MNRAIRRVGVAVVVLMLVLVAQLTWLQVIDADHLQNDPRNTRGALRDANRPRGPIVTADGVVLARSVPADDGTDFKYQREYPEGAAFSQIVGYQSFVVGNTGVEKTYNDALVGRDVDVQIQNVPDLVDGDAVTGKVVLSIRADLQREAINALGGQRGSVVAIDPKSGHLLALYSNPSYDPQPLASHDTKAVQNYYELLTADPNKPDLARAYRERYPPGSTFKTVTSAVAIDDGVATPDSPIYKTLNELVPPQTSTPLRNFGGRSCGGTLAQSFTVSCNTTFAQIGLDLGDSFVPGMARFGVGTDPPPLDIAPGAVSSVGPPEGSFPDNQPLFAQAGIGQGDVATTPLQMALVAASVADGGIIMEPHVGAEIRDASNDLVRRIEDQEWKTAMSATSAQALNSMMLTVVESPNGSGRSARIAGVSVAGKTGTAQLGDAGPPHAWFIAFAPANDPKIAVAVLVERGGDAGSEATGGAVAAPIAARIIRVALGI